MRTVFCVTALLVPAVCSAAFAAFAHVTPNTREKFNLPVCIFSNESNPETVTVRVPTPEPEGLPSIVAWLITTPKHLDSSDQEFRRYIWDDSNKDTPIESVMLLERQSEIGGVSVTMLRSAMHRTYIYIDFQRPVLDGGYYYSVDLATFVNTRDSDCY